LNYLKANFLEIPAMTDWRERCAELADRLDDALTYTVQSDTERSMRQLITRTRAELAQSEPEGVTDKQLLGCMLKAAASVPGGQCTGILHWDKEAIAAARAVLARYARPAIEPVPVAERLPGPTIMEIIAMADEIEEEGLGQVDLVRRALARWGRPVVEPVPVRERLPEPGVKVLAHYFNSHGKSRTVCARWIPAKFESRDPETDDLLEYDEDSDTFYWPEGWYEEIENWDDYQCVTIDEGEVTHWQPLPRWALPVPTSQEIP